MGLMNKLWFCGVAFVFLQLVVGILSWGQHGHYITCKIAEGYLSKDAQAAVNELLPESAEGDLAAVCSWADLFAVRSHYYWSRALHFVDTPDFRCNYDYTIIRWLDANCDTMFILGPLETASLCYNKGLRLHITDPLTLLFAEANTQWGDCHDSVGRENRCVSGAIYNYTQQLMSACHNSAPESRYNLTEALMFLSHFVGDVHQPLHCGFLGDLGGNKIDLHWYGRKANLHHVWDTEIIDTALKRFYDSDLDIMIESVQKNISENWSDYTESWEECESNRTVCPNPYASESVILACQYAYKNATPGSILKDDYFLTRLPIVERRLAQGGVRLAATLNRIFGSCGLSSNTEKAYGSSYA